MFPVRLFVPTPKAAKRVFEFFRTQISNEHTRKAYLNAICRFAQWCEARGIRELAAVEPYRLAAFIKDLQDKDRQETQCQCPESTAPGRAAHAL